ncbi:Sodium- and chloride-dependent GABA transporter ine [Gryllus bimaculatus]|nr:Sodium- and chloride-dependent GABA transporter ine [Gryllus bimaculatus]
MQYAPVCASARANHRPRAPGAAASGRARPSPVAEATRRDAGRGAMPVGEALQLELLPLRELLGGAPPDEGFERFSLGFAPSRVTGTIVTPCTGDTGSRILNGEVRPTDDELSSSSSSSASWGGACGAAAGDGASWRRPPRRQHWANKAQFVLACIGYSVGLGNVWRFPYLCYKSGGGVFLVPYLLILVVCGVPLLYMELAVGQFTRRGPIGALGQLCPIFKGAGLASVVISFLMSTYYNVIIAYALYYFFSAFKSDVPWASCGHSWNTPQCWRPGDGVLQISVGLEQLGAVRWELVACLLFAWVLVYFSLWKGVRSSGRVLYFTATFPYVVWVNALAQNFNSFGIAFGSIISFSSYNRFHNQILVDTLAVTIINAFTSILVGIFAFATIGNIASEMGKHVEDVVADGPGLVFVVYPQAMTKMPAIQLWGVLFFFMLLCLALNSQRKYRIHIKPSIRNSVRWHLRVTPIEFTNYKNSQNKSSFYFEENKMIVIDSLYVRMLIKFCALLRNSVLIANKTKSSG